MRFRGGMSKETRLIVDSVEELYNQETPELYIESLVESWKQRGTG